jgi:D-xylose transport system substrate-binding protein
VTKDNVASTVIADGFHSAADVCTGEYAAACTAAGIE